MWIFYHKCSPTTILEIAIFEKNIERKNKRKKAIEPTLDDYLQRGNNNTADLLTSIKLRQKTNGRTLPYKLQRKSVHLVKKKNREKMSAANSIKSRHHIRKKR